VLELDFAQAHFERDSRKAATIAEAAAERARAAGDTTSELLARVGAALHRSRFEADTSIDELEALARSALPRLEAAENHAGLVHVWYALGFVVANTRNRFEDWVHAAEQALRHARLAGQRGSHLFRLEHALVYGPRPAAETLRTLDALLPESPHPRSLLCRAWLLTMLARFDEADRIAREQGDRFRELTGDDEADIFLAYMAATGGRHEDAVAHLRRFCDLLEARSLRTALSVYAPMLGRSLCKLGRHDEAEPLARLGRELCDEIEPWPRALWRQVQGLVDSSRGHHARAGLLARDAVAIIERTDSLNLQGDALCDLAEVLHAAGRSSEAEAALAKALERYERKQNRAQAAQVRGRLAELKSTASP
jgi:ATP/maltotriose-dependent transcriptional regulator MalT